METQNQSVQMSQSPVVQGAAVVSAVATATIMVGMATAALAFGISVLKTTLFDKGEKKAGSK